MPTALVPLIVMLLGADPASAEDPRYRFDASRTTAEVAKGQKGLFAFQIRAAEGYYVSLKAPLKITLAAKGLTLEQSTLIAKHAKAESKSPEFEVGFAAEQPGKQQIAVDAVFFLCSDKICERQRGAVTVPVEVRPAS